MKWGAVFGLAVLIGGAPVYAQEGPPADTGAEEAEVELTEADLEEGAIITDDESLEDEGVYETEGEVIRVTGSAIQRKEVSTPAPITVVDDSSIAKSGQTHIVDVLQDLPEVKGGLNATGNNNSGTSAGAAQVSLRGVGAGRTLVLLNGRRIVPAGGGANAVVDLNVIPSAMIERVEVLNDGASAVYGSDAIGGVVNIITKREFRGVEGSVFTATTHDGGGNEYEVSVVGGTGGEIAGRKYNVVSHFSFSDKKGVRQNQREWASELYDYDYENRREQPTGSFTVPEGAILAPPPPPGAPVTDPGNPQWQALNNQYPDAQGHFILDPAAGWRPFQRGNIDTGEPSDTYNYSPFQYLSIPLRRINAFTQADMEIDRDGKTRAYVELLYNNRHSESQLAPQPLVTSAEGITVSGQNAYNPFGRDFGTVFRRMIEAGPRQTAIDINTFRVVSGIGGELPIDTWNWDVSFNFGRSWATTKSRGNFYRNRVEQALGPSTGTGAGGCGTFDDGTPCTPLNLFGGEGSITEDQLAGLQADVRNTGHTQMWSVNSTVNGKVLDLPMGGDVRVALGAQYRREGGADNPDPLVATGQITGNKREAVEGEFDAREAFAELSVVPVTGKAWAKWLELSSAIRVSNYDSYGTNLTWKTGGMWKVAGGLAARGTYSTAFRAPTVGDLFSGQSDSFDGAVDPCSTSGRTRTPIQEANCSADGWPSQIVEPNGQLNTKIGGNPKLDPETAKIFTAGVTWEPDFLPENLQVAMAADYFNIRISDQIGRLGASTILTNCYSREDRNQDDCNKVQRDPVTGRIMQINDTLTNTEGGLKTTGIDGKLAVGLRTGAGLFRFRQSGTRLLDYTSFQDNRTIDGIGIFDLGINPKWRFNSGVDWDYKGLNLGATLRYFGSVTQCEGDDCDGLPERITEYNNDVQAFTDTFLAQNPNATPDQLEMAIAENVGSAPAPGLRRPENVTADIHASYQFKTPGYKGGVTTVSAGVNNVLNQDPPFFYDSSGGGSAGIYDNIGRFYFLRLIQKF